MKKFHNTIYKEYPWLYKTSFTELAKITSKRIFTVV